MKHLTSSEKHLWKYIQDNISSIPSMSITDLSEKSNVSTATIVRTVKKMGYEGYTDLKHHLKDYIKETNKVSFEEIDSANKKIKRAINKNQLETDLTIQQVNPTIIEDVVQQIDSATKIYIFARGLSTFVAEEMTLKFNVLDKVSICYSDPNIIRTKSKTIDKKDIVIFISLNGETQELVEASSNLLENEITTILFTCSSDSSLARQSTFVFTGYKAPDSFIPEYEVKSRLPLIILTRIVLDAYAIRKNDDSN